jgi:hydrogenase expression/formation protein HypC
MCLAVPARLTSCTAQEAQADLQGTRIRVSTVLVPEAKVGDWVLVHAGFAIQQLDEQAVAETWAVLDQVAAADEASRAERR